MKSKIDWIRRGQRSLRMVAELHRLGYQKLRVMPYLNPLGFRLAVAPEHIFSRINGLVIPQCELGSRDVAITGAGGYFGWADTACDNARGLALKFIDRFPDIACQAKGRDWEYAGWLAELVGFLEQGDWIPAVWWESMQGESENLLALPIWVEGRENLKWEGGSSSISPENPTFQLPPNSNNPRVDTSAEQQSIWWGRDTYWTDALESLEEAMASGRLTVTIDMNKVEARICESDGPAYMLLEAFKSVIEHEGWHGYKGAPRLVKALLWKLKNISQE